MPQATTLVLTDHTGNKNYDPISIRDGVVEFSYGTGVPLADKRVTISVNRTPAGRRNVILKGNFPIVQDRTVDGVTSPAIVRVAYADIKFSFDASSTEEERGDAINRMLSLISSSANDWLDPVMTGTASIF